MPATADRSSNRVRFGCPRVRALVVVLGSLFVLLPRWALSAAATPEYQVKAAFLFNFTQFVDWPAKELRDPQEPFVIGVLGDDPFGAMLDEIVHGETVNGRALIVQRYRSVDDIGTCHVLFISRSEAYHLEEILRRLKGRSILTVSDMSGFARNGGVIRFVTMANKIRLRISLDAARSAGLTISSKLLRPADLVNPGED